VVERLTASASVVTLAQREPIFRQGDPATGFFIVIGGWLKLYRITLFGEEVVIRVVTRGKSFAATSAFTGDRYLGTAEAVSDARVVRIPAEHVLRCIREVPVFALAIIALTSQYLRRLVLDVEHLKAQSDVQRVAEFLASLCPVDSGPCIIALPYDKALIGGRLGPECLSRTFAKLKSFGVEVRGSRVAVSEIKKLHRLAGEARSWPAWKREVLGRTDSSRASMRPRAASRLTNDAAAHL
jgi:CRP-like cAMP-binding protein